MDDRLQQDVDDLAREREQLRLWQTGINTSVPCRVVKVNINSVDIELNVLRKFNDEEQEPLTVYGVPVAFPSTLTAGMSFPIVVGDTGLAIFQQRSISQWLEGGTTAPDSNRLHDMQDAVFIAGLKPLGEPIPPALTLKSGGMVISLGTPATPSLSIKNPEGEDLIGLLKELVQALSITTVVPFVQHSPSTPTPELLTTQAQFKTILARLETF